MRYSDNRSYQLKKADSYRKLLLQLKTANKLIHDLKQLLGLTYNK